jgi:hypothetical protein
MKLEHSFEKVQIAGITIMAVREYDQMRRHSKGTKRMTSAGAATAESSALRSQSALVGADPLESELRTDE